jgi:cytochrome P450
MQTFTPAEKKHQQDLRNLPGDKGNFLLGNAAEFGKRGPRDFGMERYRRFGPVFRYRILNQNFVGLVGPEANQLVLRDQLQNFSVRLGYAFVGNLNIGSLLGADFEAHFRDRRFIQQAFRREAMEDHVRHMNSRVQDALAEWGPQTHFHVLPAVKAVILNVAATSFMGRALDADTVRFNRLLDINLGGIATPLKLPIPFGRYARGLKAGRQVQQFLRAQIPVKRQEAANDMFSQVCQARAEDGSYQFSEAEIVSHIHLLMAGGYDTTISVLATLACQLAKRPLWQERLRQECLSLGMEAPGIDDLAQLKEVGMFYNETLRMLPTPPLPRRVLRSFTFAGQEIPANAQLHLYTNTTHFLPEIWDAPENFDPERFSVERSEHTRNTMQFCPFGGGAHTCIGMHFSVMQAKVFLFHLLTRFRLSAPEDAPLNYVFDPNPRPHKRFPLAIERLR